MIAVLVIQNSMPASLADGLAVPLFKDILIDLGWFFAPFAIFVMVGASNSVNLTDGLDGLAIVPVMIACLCFALIAYLTGNAVFANYLQINHVPGTGGSLYSAAPCSVPGWVSLVQRPASHGVHG